MAITPHHAETGSGGPPGLGGNGRSNLNDELRIQQEFARRRAQEREGARRQTAVKLDQPDGLMQANDPMRVAKRLDRVTRYMAGGDPMESPADASATSLVRSSIERASEEPAPPPAEAARRVEAELDRRTTGASPGREEGSAPVAELLLERIINTADFVSVRYLDAGVLAQHSVGRVNIRDERGVLRGYGTGFLVSPSLLLTNHHVLPDARTARSSVIEFDYQDGIDGKPLKPNVLPFAPERFFIADRELDFALVAVDADPVALAGYGFCHLTAAQGTVIIGESVTIVQHPRGEKKQIALRENRLIDIPEVVLHYAADTEPGSSGSPVFNDQWEVVALHHASVATPEHAPEYSFLNEGIRISRILGFLSTAPLTPDRRALVDQLTTAEHALTVHGGPASAGLREVPPVVNSPRREAGAVVTTGAVDGVVTIDVPLRITVQLGTPTSPLPSAIADRQVTEALAIDPDYASRSGYDPEFLGVHLPLPDVKALAAVASDELKYHHFSVVMHRPRRLALFTAVNIDGRTASRPRRDSDRWIMDPRLPREEQTGEDVYRDNPLDRGHLVRRLDPAWGTKAQAANDDTFHFTNATPQHHDFNAGSTLWLGLEDYVLNNTDNRDLAVSVVSGPVLHEDDPPYRGVALPRQFFKVVAMVTTAGALSATAYLLSQEALLDEFTARPEEFSFGAYRTFQVPVRRIADLTGLGLEPYIAGDPLGRLEARSLPREIVRPEDILLTL